jgi:hypothetical protein
MEKEAIPMRILIAILALSAAVSAQALDHSSPQLFIPIASHTNGANNTQWLTDVVIASRHANLPTIVSVLYTPHGGTTREITVPLLARQTVTLHDVVGDAFNAAGTYGTITLESLNASVPVAAHARVYNTGNPQGQFGQSMTALPLAQLGRVAWLHGLNGVDGNRTNVGIANPHDTTIGCWVSWYNRAGENFGGVGMVPVPAHGVLLINDIFDWTGQRYDEALTLRISADRPVYVYGSVVRNDTGDAYTIVGEGGEE